MNWIQALLDYAGKLWPFERVEPWEKGILITYALPDYSLHLHSPFFRKIEAEARYEPVGSGTHALVWYFQHIEKESTKPKVMDLLTQTVTTKDGVTVSFSVNIEYEIPDVESNLTNVDHFISSLEAVCRIHLARRVRELTFAELIEKQDWLEARLKDTLTTRAKRWGAQINDVGFTDLAASKAYRLLGDSKFV